MAHENKIKEYAQQAGYQPLEGRCILIRPAPDNLSEKIFSFFKSFMECDMCVLQMCGNELIFLPFHRAWGSLRKDVSLVLPYGEIQSVALEDDLHLQVNYFCSTVVRQDALEKHPGLEAALLKLDGLLSDGEMARLNYLVEVEGADEREAARNFLVEKGVLKG